jgi:hypothetical protein
MIGMDTHPVIEAMDYVSQELFIVYFSNGTYLPVTAEELRKRFADLITQTPRPDND